MILLALFACGDPYLNDPPRLISVNGVDLQSAWRYGYTRPELTVQEGVDFEIDMEIRDPEGHDFRIWFPNAPVGLEFDPDETTAVWRNPDRTFLLDVQLVMEDLHPRNPQISTEYLPINFGYEGEYIDY